MIASMLMVALLLTAATPTPGDDALALLAAGHDDDAIAHLATNDPRRTRLALFAAQIGAGKAPRAAILRVYGDRWATHVNRNEIVALLAAHDTQFRGQLSALSHADVEVGPDPPGWTPFVADVTRESLRTALPAGAADDSLRGDTLTLTLSMTRKAQGFVFPELELRMNVFELRYEVHVANRDPACASDVVGGPLALKGISPESAWKADERLDLVRLLVNDFLNRAEYETSGDRDEATAALISL